MHGSNSIAAWLSTAMLTFVGITCAYVEGYFLLASTFERGSFICREYSSAWQVQIYRPLAKIEELVTGNEVYLEHK